MLIHIKMKMLRLSKVLIHIKMKMRRLGKAKDVFIHFQPLPQIKPPQIKPQIKPSKPIASAPRPLRGLVWDIVGAPGL